MARLLRLGAALVVGFMVVAAPMLIRVPDDGCPDPFVRYDGGCTGPNELVVLTNDEQGRADVEAAVAPYRGQIVTAIDVAGAYEVRFPVARPEELGPIRQTLLAAGFTVSYSRMGETFVSSSMHLPPSRTLRTARLRASSSGAGRGRWYEREAWRFDRR